MKSLPEMAFGRNHLTLTHKISGFQLSFNAFDALQEVDNKVENLPKVAFSKDWMNR